MSPWFLHKNIQPGIRMKLPLELFSPFPTGAAAIGIYIYIYSDKWVVGVALLKWCVFSSSFSEIRGKQVIS